MTVELLVVGHDSASDLARTARHAEDVGFDTVWVADERFYKEVYSCLAHIANHTSRVLLGPCVTDPFARHPALTAMAIATLDDISQGRAILGMGTGISGFPQLGLESRKGPLALREAIGLIRKLLAGDEVDYQGEVIQFNKGRLDFKPLRSNIPVHIASNGPLGQRAAGAVADVAIMAGAGSTAEVRTFRKEVERGASAAGRDPKAITLTARLNTCIGPDGRAARDAVRLAAARYVSGGPMRLATIAEQGLELPAEVRAKVADVPYMAGLAPYASILPFITDRHVDACTLAGTVEEVTAHAIDLIDAGVSSFIVVPFAPAGGTVEGTIDSFATRVWPAVQAKLAARAGR